MYFTRWAYRIAVGWIRWFRPDPNPAAPPALAPRAPDSPLPATEEEQENQATEKNEGHDRRYGFNTPVGTVTPLDDGKALFTGYLGIATADHVGEPYEPDFRYTAKVFPDKEKNPKVNRVRLAQILAAQLSRKEALIEELRATTPSSRRQDAQRPFGPLDNLTPTRGGSKAANPVREIYRSKSEGKVVSIICPVLAAANVSL